jgi:hypothetical protein
MTIKVPENKAPIQANGSLWLEWVTFFNRLTKAVNGLQSVTVAKLPEATPAGKLIYVSDEAGGAVVAFSDGTDWRRVTDRAVVS